MQQLTKPSIRIDQFRAPLIGVVAVVLLMLMAVHVWHYWFLVDDAYIYFRYARNLAHGRGLVFNVGECVEGYTGVLWVLQLALGEWLGASGEQFAHALSLFYTAAALVVWSLFVLRQHAGGHRWAVWLIVLMGLTVNRSWAVWATSGLETRSLTFYVLLTFYLLLRAEQAGRLQQRLRRLAGASVALSLAAFSRPDAQAFFPLVVAFCIVRSVRRTPDMGMDDDVRVDRPRQSAVLSSVLVVALPFALLVGSHYLWRHAYYGDWLPNPYYAKVSKPWLPMGSRYLGTFVLEYGYYVVVPAIICTWHWIPSRLSRQLGWLAAGCMLLHTAYYCYFVGGDFFEFRVFDFYAPVLWWMVAEGLIGALAGRPLACIAVATVMLLYAAVLPVSAAIYMPLLGASDIGAVLRNWSVQYQVRTETAPPTRWLPGVPMVLQQLRLWMSQTNGFFVGVRQEALRAAWLAYKQCLEPARGAADWGHLPALTVASGTIGVLGYYLDVPVVDVLGLTDAVVAHSPPPHKTRMMAHHRAPPPGYLIDRGAHVQVRSATSTPGGSMAGADLYTPPGKVSKPYSIRLGRGVWLNIFTWDDKWVEANFRTTPTDIVPIGSPAEAQ